MNMTTTTRPRGIHDIAAHEPQRPAIAFQGSITTFGDLETAIRTACSALRDLGVSSGDRVAVMLHNRPELFALWNAVARLGALVVPIGYRSAPPEIAYLLSDSGARVFIYDDAERAEAALELDVN